MDHIMCYNDDLSVLPITYQRFYAIRNRLNRIINFIMQITIPENLSTRLRRLAARRRQPVETIVADRLFTALDDELDQLPTNEQVELRALHHLSDDVLRVIAAEQMPPANQALQAQLMERHSKGELNQAEQDRLKALVERGDQLMLRKAEAVAILVNRGYAELPNDLITANA